MRKTIIFRNDTLEVGLEDLLWSRRLDLDLLCSITAPDLKDLYTLVDPLINLKENTTIQSFENPQFAN